MEWNSRRTQGEGFCSLDAVPGRLRLFLEPASIGQDTTYAFLGVRQRHFQFEAATRMEFSPTGNEEAGLVVIQNDRSAFAMTLTVGESGPELRLSHLSSDGSSTLARQPVVGGHDALPHVITQWNILFAGPDPV